MAIEAVAEHFGVSEQMMRWRLAHTGATKQVERERARLVVGRRRRATSL